MDDQKEEFIKIVIGDQLGAVTFVQDYVQLQFDPCYYEITAFATPIVSIAGKKYDWHTEGYRDILCGQIAKIVSSVEERDFQLIIEFEDGSQILVSFNPYDHPAMDNDISKM